MPPATMVQIRNNPTASEWTAIKSEFKHLYLERNMKLKDIKETFFKHHGFNASDRQYKMRVKHWNLDCKKIKGPIWHSMFIVMKHRNAHGLSSVFKVPIRGDDHEIVKADRITKQINRDRTVFDPSNLQRAQEILREAKVEIYTIEEERALTRNSSAQAPESSQAFNLKLATPWQPSTAADERASGTKSPSRTPQPEGSRSNTASTIEASTNIRPIPHVEGPASIASSSSVSYPSTSGVEGIGWAVNRAPATTTVTSQNTQCTFDINAMMESFFTDMSCATQLHAETAHQSGQARACEGKQLAVAWVGPYLQLYVRREPLTADWFRTSREAAKRAFHDMLGSDNKYTFPYCNWMVTVLASNEQTTLLTVFLMDCCEVIDLLGDRLQGTYGAPFHLLLALYTQRQENVEDCHTDFENSMMRIGLIWGRSDPNYLVNHCTWAWLMLEKGRHQEALAKLREYLPITEHTMGSQHVVTLNYLTVYARALAETGGEAEALSILNDVSHRLNGCTDLLQGYRYRQLMRLAELQIETGDFGSAEANLIATIQFRTHHFGMGASCTWKAIEKYRDFLRMQQRFHEADILWDQGLQRYQEETASK